MQAQAKRPMFFVAVPTNGEHSYYFTQFLGGMQWPTNCTLQSRYVAGMEVGHARNILVQEAINCKAKYLLFLDEDVTGPAETARKLMYHLDNHPEWTVVGGVYCTKTFPPEPLIFMEWGDGPYWGWKIGDMLRVKSTGCGMHLFRVADLAAMKLPKEYEVRNPWTGEPMIVREWFKTDKQYVRNAAGGMELHGHTEDSWFYSMCEQEGLQVWIDTGIQGAHYNKENKTFYVTPVDGNGTAAKPDPWNRTPRIANLGAGQACSPYEVNVDLRKDDPNITYQADIRNMPEAWTGQFDGARAHHVLEHFPWHQSEEILREWARILKPGGELEIIVPDLQYAAEQVLRGVDDPYLMGIIYGDQGSPFWGQNPYGGHAEDGRHLPHSFEYNGHKAGFTAASLGRLMHKIGLVEIEGERIHRAIRIVGRKPEEAKAGGERAEQGAGNSSTGATGGAERPAPPLT